MDDLFGNRDSNFSALSGDSSGASPMGEYSIFQSPAPSAPANQGVPYRPDYNPSAPPPAPPPPPNKYIPPIKWAYPLNLKNDVKGFGPAMYFEGLARALGGSYPLGDTGLLHPGIHADLGSSAYIDPKTVLAIADGEIVAYRMDAEPLSVQYPAMSEAVKYSSSFVLIKHQFALPPKPLAPDEAAPTTPAPSEAINLFSLYMHLQDAKAYANAELNLQKPPYLPVKYRVKAGVNNPVLGLRVRDKPGGVVLGIIPLLGKVQTGAEHLINPKWKKYLGVSGVDFSPVASMPEGKSPTVDGYVFIDTLDANKKVIKDSDKEPNLIAQRVTYIYNQDKARGRKVIANLPVGAVLTLGEKSRHDSSFYAVISVENLQGFMAPTDASGKCIGWVDMDDLEEQPFTPPAGVQIVNPPIAVKAGQLIGHPGVFQHHNNGSQQKQLHLELFTPDDLPAFIAKGKSWAQDPNVKTTDKTLVKVSKGKTLKAAEVNNAGELKTPVTTPPKIDGADDVALHSDIILPLQALNALPADYKMSLPESDAPNAVKLQWWFLDNVAGQADGTKIKGWLCEKDTTRLSPWSWEGFTTLEDNTTVEDNTLDEKLIAYQLMLANKLRGEELNTYSRILNEAKNLPVIKYLVNTVKDNLVDGVTITDSITPAQLRDATRGYWCAQKIASVAVKTKSEWKKDPARWNALNKIFGHTDANPNKNWLTEKSKIEKLSFWDEVSGVVGNTDGKVWGLNSIEFVVRFNNRRNFNPDKFVELYIPKHEVEFGGIERDVKTVVRPFNQASQANLRRLAQDIAIYFENNPDECWIPYMAYMLATARLEAYNFRQGIYFTPIAEIITSEQAERRYGSGATADDAERAISMGNTDNNDGFRYRGRGFVQLTWKNNYRGRDNDFFGGSLDLVNNPDKAMLWDNASIIMIKGMLDGSFTGKKLLDFISVSNKNYKGARKVINGTNHDDFIASYAVLFEKLIEGAIE